MGHDSFVDVTESFDDDSHPFVYRSEPCRNASDPFLNRSDPFASDFFPSSWHTCAMADATGTSSSTVDTIRDLLAESPPGPLEIVELLRIIREYIPDFGPKAESELVQLRGSAFVDPKFVQASINTVGASTNVENMIGRSSGELRQETQDVARWSAVEHELQATLKGVSAANLVRKHRIGLTALQTYNVARQLVRSKTHAHLLPYVAEMKRQNRFGRKHPSRAAAAVTPQEEPSTET